MDLGLKNKIALVSRRQSRDLAARLPKNSQPKARR